MSETLSKLLLVGASLAIVAVPPLVRWLIDNRPAIESVVDKPAGKQIVVDGEGFESVDNHFFGLADLTKEQ